MRRLCTSDAERRYVKSSIRFVSTRHHMKLLEICSKLCFRTVSILALGQLSHSDSADLVSQVEVGAVACCN